MMVDVKKPTLFHNNLYYEFKEQCILQKFVDFYCAGRYCLSFFEHIKPLTCEDKGT